MCSMFDLPGWLALHTLSAVRIMQGGKGESGQSLTTWCGCKNESLYNELLFYIVFFCVHLQLPWLQPFVQSIFWLGLFILMKPSFPADRFAGERGGVQSILEG